MTLQARDSELPEASIAATASGRPSRWQRACTWGLWLALAGLLGVAQVALAGYRFGVGNQSIQIPFLKYFMNPALYPRDDMVQRTLRDYPSYFYRLLAWATPHLGGVAPAFFMLHVLTAVLASMAILALGRAMFRDFRAGFVAVLLLLGGHHRALAGDDLYSLGFTHTWAVFPVAIASLALLYRRHYTWALLVAGVAFNLHALTAAYVAFVTGFVAAGEAILCGAGESWTRRWLWRPLKQAGPGAALFLCAAAPTLFLMMSRHQAYDQQWLDLTYLRSADHSFPFSWWQAGLPDVPRFALIAGLAGLSWSLTPRTPARRRTGLAVLAVGVLFLAGVLLTQVWPVATVIRAQLFRSSRLLLVILFCQIAWGILTVWRSAGGPAGRWQCWLERGAALASAAIVVVPVLLPLLPYAFVLTLMAALCSGRLSLGQAVLAGTVLLTVATASQEIEFAIPGLAGSGGWNVRPAGASLRFWGLLSAATVLAGAAWGPFRWWLQPAAAVMAAAIAVLAAPGLLREQEGMRGSPYQEAQRWAKENTSLSALFLTPTQPGGFRIGAERSVVAEWRDGTQLYFTADFAPRWWQRIKDLQPGVELANDNRHLLLRGRSMETLSDAQLVALADTYHASYILLPAARASALKVAYRNEQWAIYLPQLPPAPPPPPAERDIAVPKEALDRAQWIAQEKFMDQVVLPNIEKYRKSNVEIRILDRAGRPMEGLAWEVNQTRQAFGFSASLPFFKVPPAPSTGDFKPRNPVDQRELDRMLEIFNSSLIAFSAKWMYLEPQEGKYWFDDIDTYVDWGQRHQIPLEWHFLSGYGPLWVYQKPESGLKEALLKHVRTMVSRYGDKITWWQVTNEHIFEEYVPDMCREIRAIKPDAKLGVSFCEKFWVPGRGPRQQAELYDGLETIRKLKAKGVKIDYYAPHGHRPFGLWADPQMIYTVFDTFAREGVKIHVTEFFEPVPTEIIGPMRTGRWTPELQAEYYRRMFQIVYSHPAAELINIWGIGPQTWQDGAGLLKANYEPKPAFSALKQLIQNEWKTHASGRLAADGSAVFRAFHGDYELVVTLPDGRRVRGAFAVRPPAAGTQPTATMPAAGAVGAAFRLDTEKETLEQQ